MSDASQTNDGLDRLLDALVEGLLSDSECDELANRLRNDETAQAKYAAYVALHAMLKFEHARPLVQPSVSSIRDTRHDSADAHSPNQATTSPARQDSEVDHLKTSAPMLVSPVQATSAFRRPLVWSMLAASVLFAAYFTAISWNMFADPRKNGGPGDAAEHFNIARDTAEGKLVPDKAALERPTAVIGRPVAISSGIVLVRLKQGASMLVEGPAQWTVTGKNEVALDFGTFVAHVPKQAHGFTLNTSTTTIVDLGTEFGVNTDKRGSTDVHVLKGSIEVAQLANGKRKPVGQIKAGESVTVGNGQTPTVVKEKLPEEFRKLAEFGRTRDEKPAAAPTTGLVAYYPFDGDTRDHAADYSENSGTVADDLKTIEGHEFFDGRVGKALRLMGGYATSSGSRDLQLRPTFTIEAWLSPERITDSYQRGLCCWGPNSTSYHFSMLRAGMELAISQANGTFVRSVGGTLKPWQWQHVAGVADGKQLIVYINGQQVVATPYDGTMKLSDQEGLGVGDNSVGNSPSFRPRGAIDEVAIWNVPLSAEQIAAHYLGQRDGYGLHKKQK